MKNYIRNFLILSYLLLASFAAQAYDAPTGTGLIVHNSGPSIISPSITGSTLITSTSANSFTAGVSGNPQFNIDSSVSSAVTGLDVQGQAAGTGIWLIATSTSSNENINLIPKGTGAVNIQNTSAGGNVPLQINAGTNNIGITVTSSQSDATSFDLINTNGHDWQFSSTSGGNFAAFDNTNQATPFLVGGGTGSGPGTYLSLLSTGCLGFSNSTEFGGAPDTCLSRDSAGSGIVDVGVGTAADKSGTINAAHANFSSDVTQTGYGFSYNSTHATTSWTSPSYTTSNMTFKVTSIGGGGAGGVSSATTKSGGGGGSGAVCVRYYTGLTASHSYTIAVGNAGSSSTFSDGTTTLTATTGSAGGTAGVGGAAGTCTNATYPHGAQPGGSGINVTGTAGDEGETGGGNPYGTGGIGSTTGTGGSASGCGAGGGGAINGQTGGAGAVGCVLIEWIH